VEVRNDPVRHAVRPLRCVVVDCRAAPASKQAHGERGGP
jgi:hypothetical protein